MSFPRQGITGFWIVEAEYRRNREKGLLETASMTTMPPVHPHLLESLTLWSAEKHQNQIPSEVKALLSKPLALYLVGYLSR